MRQALKERSVDMNHPCKKLFKMQIFNSDEKSPVCDDKKEKGRKILN